MDYSSMYARNRTTFLKETSTYNPSDKDHLLFLKHPKLLCNDYKLISGPEKSYLRNLLITLGHHIYKHTQLDCKIIHCERTFIVKEHRETSMLDHLFKNALDLHSLLYK